MATRSHSTVHMFVLVGLNQQPELQLNQGMILLIAVCPLLPTPMYYFLGRLSFIDLSYTSLITPKMLVNFVARKNTILYSECMAQLFFFAVFAVVEGYLLTTMAYDRYIAVYNPLLYHMIMAPWPCSLLVLVSFTLGILSAVAHTSGMMKLDFCQPHIISHYFCDVLTLFSFCFSSTHLSELLLFFIAGFNTLVPTLAVAVSYIFIFCSVLHIQSSQGWSKVFGTCSSHVTMVGIFFGSITYINSLEQEEVSSVFCTTVIPMLNPLIYSLWNQDVNKALRRVWMGR
uniref:Olfactory receptor n=1 Tax=Cavia porcellus TaxID=10141 RepID=A0A286Y5P7_CAVPO